MAADRHDGANGPLNGDDGCSAVAGWLAAYAGGDLDERRERRVRDHLVACGACRESAAALDPSLLFLELRGAPLPGSFWTGFSTRLRARLVQEPPSRWAWFGLPRAASLAAPLAMLLLLAGTLYILRPPRHRGPRAGRGGRPPLQAQGQPAPGTQTDGSGTRSGGAGPAGAAAQGAPVIEEVGSPGARVYRFTVGGPGEETPIYLVVDEAIDI